LNSVHISELSKALDFVAVLERETAAQEFCSFRRVSDVVEEDQKFKW
jgi:hypothetical protein